MNNYTDRFLEAMKVVSNKKQVAADYDKTIRAQIAGIPTEDKKYYTIQYNDLQYKVRTWYEEYVIGDVVYVRVIGGKMDGDKIIEGKVAPILQDRNSTSMVEIPMSKKQVLSEGANMNYNEQSIYTDNAPNEEILNNSLKQNCLRITAEFQPVQSPDEVDAQLDFINDYYGLKIILSNNREYEFTCKDFMGNPYQSDQTYQTYDIYFSEPIKDPGIQIKSVKAIKAGDFYTNCSVNLSNLTAQFITVKSYSDEDWVMTYSTDTGYIQKSEEDKIILKSRLFYKGREMFQKDLENNQKVVIERLSHEFKWERFEVVAPGTDYNFTNINFNEYYIRYKFVEKINQEERVLASSDIIKIQNKTLINDYIIDQIDKYAVETTGLYLGSDFKLLKSNGDTETGVWGYGSLEKYDSYQPVLGEIKEDGKYNSFSSSELPYIKIFSAISSLPNAIVMNYVKINNNYHLIKKQYTPPTADEQARQLTTSMHLFPKSTIVKYDADGILGSNNQIYKITPNASFFPANDTKIKNIQWEYIVDNVYVYYDGVEEDSEEKGATVTGIYTWIWEKNDNESDWISKGFVFSYKEELEGKSIISPEKANGNLFASFDQGNNGELQFTAVNKYNHFFAGFNNLTFSIVYKDETKIDYPFEVNFLADGNLGTNGTKYALIIEDFWRDMATPYITSRDWNGLYLRAQLFNTETNQIVPDSAISWTWAPNFIDRLYWELNGNSSEIQYLFNKTTEKEALEKSFKSSILDFSKFYATNSGGNEFYTYYLANSVTKINNKVTDHQDFSSASFEEELSVNYVELTAEYDGNTITSTYTIPITSHLNTPNEYTDYVSKITLPESDIQYSSDHSFIIGNSSDSIKVYVSSSNINNIESIGFMPAGNWGRYCEPSISYIIFNEESGMEYNLSKIKDDNDNSLVKEGDKVIGKQLNIKYKTLNADLTALLENNYDYFGLYIVYNYEKVNEPTPLQRIIGKTFSISCNRYFNSMINDWDGKSKLIEDAVLTPQVIAGSKDKDNGFSGAMIGRVDDKPNGPGGITRTRYGLFGYGKGVETFGIDSSTGDAHFEGDITARSLTLLPEVADAAGLESGIVRGRKKGLVARQFSDYWKDSSSDQDEKELVTENLVVGYIYSHPDATNHSSLTPIINEQKDSNGETIIKHAGKPQSSYLIELPGVVEYKPDGKDKKYFPYGFQFMLDNNSSSKKRIVGSPSKKLLFSFVAKIPIEAEVRFITGNVGGNSEDGRITWLTPRQGTGKFEEYRIFVQCGSEPSDQKKNYEYGIEENIGTEENKQFGTTGYFILTDHSQAADPNQAINLSENPSKKGYWLLASAECYEIFDDNLTEAEDLVGNFAGWQIKKDSLSYKKKEDDNYLHSFIQPATASKTAYTVGNGENKTDWAMYFGGLSNKVGNFGVDQSGKLYAQNADINGTIHATSLTLGDDAKIDDKLATKDYVNTQIGNVQQPTNTLTYTYDSKNQKYYVNNPSTGDSSELIEINSKGALVATNAIIEGTIVSGSTITGEIKGAKGHVSSEFAFGTNESLIVLERSENPSGNGGPYSGILSHKTRHSSLILGDSAASLEYDPKQGGISSITIGDSISISALSSLRLDSIQFGLEAVDDCTLDAKKGYLKGTWYKNGDPILTNSDIKLKNTIDSIDSNYSNFFDNLRPVTYKYNDGTSDRLHTGFIAQEIKNALDIAGIDTKDFAGLAVKDQGTEDESWYLRYEEFIALNTQQIQKAKARISELETRVSQLEELLQANSK